MTKLIEAIIQVWYLDPKTKENCKRLVESMPNRVKDVLKNKGDILPTETEVLVCLRMNK